MKVVCPQDVKKMLLKQARLISWKKRAAKHECEELDGANPSHAAKKDQRGVD